MKIEYTKVTLNLAALQGKYEESKYHNKQLLDYRKQQTAFFRTCAETVTDIQAVTSVAVAESSSRCEDLISQIKDRHTAHLNSLQEASNQPTSSHTVNTSPTPKTYSETASHPSYRAPKRKPPVKQDTSVLLVYPKPENRLQTSEETRDSICRSI